MKTAKDAHGFAIAEAPLEHGGIVLAIRGELDIATAPTLRARVRALSDAGVRRVVFDLRDASFVDSTGLAVFIRAKTRFGEGARMALVIPPDSYARLIFDVVGLAGVLNVVDTLDEGIQQVAG